MGPVVKLCFEARAAELRRVRDEVRSQVRACGGSPDCAADVALAVDEACQNIIRHAYRGDPKGLIELSIEQRGEELVLTLVDFSPAIDPAKVKPRDLDDVRPGGLGTHLIRELMDQAEFEAPAAGEGNRLRMVKRLV